MKNQSEDKFEQRIRKRLQSVESSPPEGAWDRLVADLPTASSPRYRRWIAAVVLIGITVGGAVWWTQAHRPTAQKRIMSKSAFDGSRANPPRSSPATPPAESLNSYEPTKPSRESSNQSLPSSQQLGRDSARSNQTADGTDLWTKRRLSRNRPPTRSRSSLDPATPAPVPASKETRHRFARVANERTTVPIIAPNRPSVVAGLPEVALAFPPSRFGSGPSSSPEVVPTPRRWELWVTANPILLYQRVSPNASDAIQVTSLNRTTFSRDRLGLQASAGGLYQLNPRLALKLGVYYRYTRDQWTYSYHENATDTFRVVRVDENTVEATPVYEEQVGTVSETSHRIGALAGVQYRLSSRWFSNIIGAELQAQQHLGSLAWYAHVGYVAERKLSDRWSVYGGPSFLWNFSGPGTRRDHFVLKPYGFGAQVGVSYRLQFKQ